MIKEVCNFAHVLDVYGNIRLPKHALFMRQSSCNGRPSRFVYVIDARDVLKDSFRVYSYTPSTGKLYYYRSFVGDSIGKAFRNYVRDTYTNKHLQVPAPIWPIYHRDNIGQPKDRRPQKFDAKHAYIRGERRCEERYVTDGAVIGTFRHTDESYSHVRLGMDTISFNEHVSKYDINSLELPSLI